MNIPTADEFLYKRGWNTNHPEIKMMAMAVIEFAK
jgi:hypothetical protein